MPMGQLGGGKPHFAAPTLDQQHGDEPATMPLSSGITAARW
jgi:hypothetical protein